MNEKDENENKKECKNLFDLDINTIKDELCKTIDDAEDLGRTVTEKIKSHKGLSAVGIISLAYIAKKKGWLK